MALSPNDATQCWLSLWPTDESPCICSITSSVSAATFPEKSKAAHSLAFNKAFNATDSLFNSPVDEAVHCFLQSVLLLWVNSYYGRTNKGKIDDYRRWNLTSEVHKLQLLLIAIGAVEDNKMKIVEILTLSKKIIQQCRNTLSKSTAFEILLE